MDVLRTVLGSTDMLLSITTVYLSKSIVLFNKVVPKVAMQPPSCSENKQTVPKFAMQPPSCLENKQTVPKFAMLPPSCLEKQTSCPLVLHVFLESCFNGHSASGYILCIVVVNSAMYVVVAKVWVGDDAMNVKVRKLYT